MTKPGAKTLPTTLKLLRGERRASRLNLEEPTPAGAPKTPVDLDPDALAVWQRVLGAMAGTDVITLADQDIFRAYCRAVVRLEQADRLLLQSGPLIKGRDGMVVKNPAGVIARQEALLVARLAGELGLTPSARTALRSAKPRSDPFEEYLSRGRRRASA